MVPERAEDVLRQQGIGEVEDLHDHIKQYEHNLNIAESQAAKLKKYKASMNRLFECDG